MTEHYWTPQSNVSNETSTNKTFQRTISAQVHTNKHTQNYCNIIYQHDMTTLSSANTGIKHNKHAHTCCLFFSSALSLTHFCVCMCVCVFVCVCQTLQDTLAYATALLNEKEQSGSSNGSDGSPANENAERSLRQVAGPPAPLHSGRILWLIS